MSTETTPVHPCELLSWDSEFWGFPIARVNESHLTERLIEQVDEWCVDNRVACLYFRAGGRCPRTLALAAAHGFRFIDVRIELTRSTTAEGFATAALTEDDVRPATEHDLPFLRAIAANAHRDTRFFKDERFDANRAAELYEAWIERGVARDYVLVCASQPDAGRPYGYITCERNPCKGEGSIGLIAVASSAKGRGMGSCLVREALRWFASEAIPTIRVVTQATNIPAMRLYETAGFRTSDVSIWFHKWFHDIPRIRDMS